MVVSGKVSVNRGSNTHATTLHTLTALLQLCEVCFK